MSTPSPAPELVAIRDELAAKDRELVAILAERMRLIREVARIKGEKGLPSFDREREGAHLDDLVALGRTMNVPDDVVRDVYARLFAASRLEQRRILQTKAEHFSVGIIGATQGMGAFLARVLKNGGFEVETMGLGEGPKAEEVASRNDLVIVAVPIAATVDVIRRIAPHVRPGACLMDITSIKSAPLKAMLEAAPEGVDVVATHPMFGPHGGDFDRQKVVLCRGRGDAAFARVKKLFESFGAETIEATAEEHDAQMALIQVLVHEKTMVLGSVLERLKADLGRSLQFASPIYRTELAMIGRMFSQRAELYADILTVNPEAPRLSHVFEQEAAHFARAVAMGDRESVVKRFREVAEFMKDFASWAKKQSDAILDDLVRHG
ncbi:Prephenate and/or arogenate dehydrogenase [Labilithrix luteola]|uniref:chorismate mutase n=1 Tax=Labilithrix luteola TaxID=1391654 RepID=A0A0K1PQJ5_9BACT|nr:bifunctional chorismate mutase/prephenate dehydrogenase [Labilithrix luteola]AKU95792.1 Prephenate and/or arogenate dehydrogenase [Labilithrix luteola]